MPSDPSTARESTELTLVYTTLPDQAAAETLGRALIEAQLAACVNIYPGMTALYEWKGTLERASETGMIIKTVAPRLPALLEKARALHPYETPALLVLGRATANPDYLAWAKAQTGL
jgi:periplasmic divalent cation tolerance protein